MEAISGVDVEKVTVKLIPDLLFTYPIIYASLQGFSFFNT